MTNHEQAKAYMKKQSLLGNSKLVISLAENDYVYLNSDNTLYNDTDKIIKIPGFITHISAFTFRNNKIIEKIEFMNPDNINEIGMLAFDGCKALKEIKLPQNINKINTGILAECGIKELKIPNKCEEIGSSAFDKCTELNKVTIDLKNSKLRSISEYSFKGCEKIYLIELPESLDYINKDAFRGIGHGVILIASKKIVDNYNKKVRNVRICEYGTVTEKDIKKWTNT